MGVGLGGSASPNLSMFWNWNQGNAVPNYYSEPQIGQSSLEQSIPTNYYQFKTGLGIPDNGTAFSRWVDQQLSKYTLGYNAYTAAHPLTADLGSYDATLGNYGDWQRAFLNQAPQIRGRDDAAAGGGPVRWIRS